jgi:sporulation protein YlmC with PRC-barrel domain
MRHNEFDVGYWLLDDELVDARGRRCGRVDDVELSGGPGRKATISKILSGPGVFPGRLPERLRPLARRFLSDHVVEVPWSEVKDVDVVVRLKRRAEELGLGRGDDEASGFLKKLPGS